MNKIDIPSRIHDYSVEVHDELAPLTELCLDPFVVVVADRRVHTLHPSGFAGLEQHRLLLLDATEGRKTLDTVAEIYRFLLAFPAKRNLHLVSVGGGIIQDVTGFASSTLFRGVRWTFFPTTLLAQADSCVGGKTSLNFEHVKNSVGSFYPPHRVVICTSFLATLEPREISSGVGEIIKFMLLSDLETPSLDGIAGVVADVSRGAFAEAILQTHCVKRSYIAQDEFDRGKRNLFNYGHCIGHALESTSEFRIPHGIAVTIGMSIANEVSVARGLLSTELRDALQTRLFEPNISVPVYPRDLAIDPLVAALSQDKKRTGPKLTMILLNEGPSRAVKADDVAPEEVARAVQRFAAARGLA